MNQLSLFQLALLAAALGSGLIAGVFYAFSTFVMGALGKLPPANGIAAMQSINIVVINPWFMTAFFGTALLCVILAFSVMSRWSEPGALLIAAGCLFYLVGTIGTTMIGNVPLNNALARVDPSSSDGATLWADYLNRWTFLNHVRTAAALAAAALLTLAFAAA